MLLMRDRPRSVIQSADFTSHTSRNRRNHTRKRARSTNAEAALLLGATPHLSYHLPGFSIKQRGERPVHYSQ
jgi:hypothetical protein